MDPISKAYNEHTLGAIKDVKEGVAASEYIFDRATEVRLVAQHPAPPSGPDAKGWIMIDASSGSTCESLFESRCRSEFVIGSVPNGGYVACLLIAAAESHMQSFEPSKPDPFHWTGQYLNPTAIGPAFIHVKHVKSSKRWTYLTAEVRQKTPKDHHYHTTLSSQLIFSNFDSEKGPTALHTAKLLKVLAPPSKCELTTASVRPWPFDRYFDMFVDKVTTDSVQDWMGNATAKPWKDQGKAITAETKHWIRWIDSRPVDPRCLALYADLFRPPSMAYPKEIVPSKSWFPTLTLSIEFKCNPSKLPSYPKNTSPTKPDANPERDSHLVGVTASTRFLNNGRAETDAELCMRGLGANGEDIVVAIARQMCLVVPFAMNERNKKPDDAKARI